MHRPCLRPTSNSDAAMPHLYFEGDASLLSPSTSRVSVIGSRRASRNGLARARRLSRILVGAGVVVVSGLARGVDTAAHRAALAQGGRTVAVLGTSVHRFYPPENEALQGEIARDHLVVSQFATDGFDRRRFVARNRTMAALSDAVVIIEAEARSGTVSAGRAALDQGVPLWVLRSAAEREGAEWADALVRRGARVLSEPDALLSAVSGVSAGSRRRWVERSAPLPA